MVGLGARASRIEEGSISPEVDEGSGLGVLGRREDPLLLLWQGLPWAVGRLDLSGQGHQTPHGCLEGCAEKVRKPFLQKCVQGLISDVCPRCHMRSDAMHASVCHLTERKQDEPGNL